MLLVIIYKQLKYTDVTAQHMGTYYCLCLYQVLARISVPLMQVLRIARELQRMSRNKQK